MPDFTRGTGSGKTFTMANVMEQLQKPTLVTAHNKILAAQLYGEFKEMFPDNAVEYLTFSVPGSENEVYLVLFRVVSSVFCGQNDTKRTG